MNLVENFCVQGFYFSNEMKPVFYLRCLISFLVKARQDRSTTHRKFDLTGVQTHDPPDHDCTFHVTETPPLTTEPSVITCPTYALWWVLGEVYEILVPSDFNAMLYIKGVYGTTLAVIDSNDKSMWPSIRLNIDLLKFNYHGHLKITQSSQWVHLAFNLFVLLLLPLHLTFWCSLSSLIQKQYAYREYWAIWTESPDRYQMHQSLIHL